MRAFALLFVVMLGASRTEAQSGQRCPVSVEGEGDTIGHTNPIVFTARVAKELLTAELKYKWQVSADSAGPLRNAITAGQNTSSITVDIADLDGQSVTATVEISGLSDSCSSASKTVRIIAHSGPPHPTAFDKYGDLKFEAEKARLDRFALILIETPTLRGVICVLAGQLTYHGEASDRLRRTKNYLVNVRRIPSERIITIDSGYTKELTTWLWIVPKEAPLPSLESTVPVQEVRFNKRRPKTQ